MGVNRRIKYIIPSKLYAISTEYAYKRYLTPHQYTYGAFLLLNRATERGFDCSRTRLVRTGHLSIAIPRLDTNPESSATTPVNITAPEYEHDLFAKYAAEAQISPDARMAQAQRFANFLTRHSLEPDFTFEHDNTDCVQAGGQAAELHQLQAFIR